MNKFFERLRRVWLILVSSLFVDLLVLFVLFALAFLIGNPLFWKVIAIILSLSLLLINYNLNYMSIEQYYKNKKLKDKLLNNENENFKE